MRSWTTRLLLLSPLRQHRLPAASRLHRFFVSASRTLSKTVPDARVPPPQLPTASQTTTPLPYFVHRTGSKNLPVYEETKRGNYLQTRIRKCEGNIGVLREQLMKYLGIPKDKIFVNNLTKHVIVRLHCKARVQEFLKMQNF